MKKTCKTIGSLALLVLLVLSLASTAFAASITFRGFSEGFHLEPGSEFTETDLFGGLKNVMPGDTRTETITFTNAAADCDFVNLYLRAEVHDETANPLSGSVEQAETTVASMTDFLSQLSMKVWNGTELIYEASPHQPDGLAANRLLGTFRTGDTVTLKVELTVPLTLGNEYASRVGEVDWVFHVEAYNESQLTVRKVWSDGNRNHANDSITVHLLKDGKTERSQVLNAENGWAYTFDGLQEGHRWTVEEVNVPAGYRVSYSTVGTTTTITNTRKYLPPDPPKPPVYPQTDSVDMTVHKDWSGDSEKDRPQSVTVTLYDGETAVETVSLGSWNSWTYRWKDLSAQGNWQVLETNIPKGYVPYYRVAGDTVTITNTASLIKTGQLRWPIAVLCGLGVVLLAGGVVITTGKRKNRNV